MYRNFGAIVDHANKTVQFRVFFPDHEVDPNQYYREYNVRDDKGKLLYTNKGGKPEISEIRVVGDFQGALGGTNWDVKTAPVLGKIRRYPETPDAAKGFLYESDVINLSDGFFQYRYQVLHSGETEHRLCNDPCTKYHDYRDGDGDASGFVIGGNPPIEVQPIADRLPLGDLVIYELHLEDFTWETRRNEAPMAEMLKKVEYLESLGVNAVEILPWTGCSGSGYSWGYTPFLYFSVTNRYVDDKKYPLEKISQLKALINALHSKGIHVIMDGVYNHVSDMFPYYQLYKDRDVCPFIGNFKEYGSFGQVIDFNNECANEFILSVCKYWIDVFKVDGIRFDYVKGFYDKEDRLHGFRTLIEKLNDYIAEDPARKNISLTLELLNGYDCINDTNTVDATGCWLDDYLWRTYDFIEKGRVNKEIMRILNANKDFKPGKSPVIYAQNHDHRTLVNSIGKGNYSRGEAWRTQPYIIALFTSPGAILMHSGMEWGENTWMPEGSEEGPSRTSRILHRAIHWSQQYDAVGTMLASTYKKLIEIRNKHSALRSPNFYPADDYSTSFNQQGYGFHEEKQVVIYHRYDNSERFIVVINFSQNNQQIDIPFPANGVWRDLLNEHDTTVSGYWLRSEVVNSNWGKIFWQKIS
ncbi:alpha amylase C-terminal domain-containing protein [Geomonas sp. RF6]|uniref:alpha-amylase family glycosyl hydrolase n=1 Tax=Geomonas sp. RF6 TaxID=2897342 RepID=UPI001E3232C8|nr:alpha-amylase family glycosyl hydrolase [Geomonas sp. RF6]UFS70241.1 alpha amylase C-terminal domain-containing protein [Geomonas sp. RF6]